MTKYAIIIVGSHESIMRGSGEHFKNCLIRHGVKKDYIKLVEPKGLTQSKTADKKVKEIFKAFNDKKKIGPKDSIYLYLVGHGFTASIVLDVSSKKDAEGSPLFKRVPYAMIFKMFKHIPAAKVNIIVDSCESGRAVEHLKLVKDPLKRYTIVTATDQNKKASYWQFGLEQRTDTIKKIVDAIDNGSNFLGAGLKMQKAFKKYKPQVSLFSPCPKFEVTTVSRDYEKNIVTVVGKVSYLDGSSPAGKLLGMNLYGYTPVVGMDCKIQNEKREDSTVQSPIRPKQNGCFTVKSKILLPYRLYDVTLSQSYQGCKWIEPMKCEEKIFSDRLSKPKDAFYKELPEPVQVALYKELPKHVQAALTKCYIDDLLDLLHSQILQPVIDTLKRLVSFAPSGNNYTPRMRDAALAELNSLYDREDIKEEDLLKVLAVPDALRMDGYSNIILLMRDTNKRQHALGIPQSDGGMGGTPDGGRGYPPLNALNDVQELTPFMRAVHGAICVLGLYPKGTLYFLRGYKVQYSPGC